MALDPVTNFAKVDVSTGYDASATSIVLNSGGAAELPDPSVDGAFNLVWWNITDYPDPSDDPNVEIVRVTAISTETLTVSRAQEDSSATTKNTASKEYKMILGITKKVLDDISASSGTRSHSVGIISFPSSENVSTGNGTQFVSIPECLNGARLTNVTSTLSVVGSSSGTTDIQVRRQRLAANADMLSTKVTIATTGYTASDGIIDSTNDQVLTGDKLFVDVDATTSGAPLGLSTTLTLTLNGSRKSYVGINVVASDTALAVEDGTSGFCVPIELAHKELTEITASVGTAGTTGGTTDVQVRRKRLGTDANMLSTAVTLSAAEYTASDGVVDTANDDILAGDLVFVDVAAINTVAPEGLSVTLTFE